MDKTELEVSITPKIRDAVNAAIVAAGAKAVASSAGLEPRQLEGLLDTVDAFIPLTLVSAACLINKTHSNTNPTHTSVSECLKGATIRLPQSPHVPSPPTTTRPRPLPRVSGQKRPVRLMDPQSIRIIDLGGNLAMFFLLGYFLGGIALGPLFGQAPCLGLSFSPPTAAPCLGSYAGLVLGAIASLAYTVYFFIKKV